MGTGLVTPYDELLARSRALAASGRRQLLGITGTPGPARADLARRLVEELGPQACLVPMDGFRLPGAVLERIGLAGLVGTPDEVDADGYLSVLRRIRRQEDPVVYAPAVDEVRGEPLAGVLPVPRHVPLVVTEGDYLLLEDGTWAVIGSLLDVVWFVDAEEPAVPLPPLQRRTADLVASTRARADLVVRV